MEGAGGENREEGKCGREGGDIGQKGKRLGGWEERGGRKGQPPEPVFEGSAWQP